jgi:hypothetical protein
MLGGQQQETVTVAEGVLMEVEPVVGPKTEAPAAQELVWAVR